MGKVEVALVIGDIVLIAVPVVVAGGLLQLVLRSMGNVDRWNGPDIL